MSVRGLYRRRPNQFYVDPITGSDSNSGSYLHPLQTFARALVLARNGSYIFLLAGSTFTAGVIVTQTDLTLTRYGASATDPILQSSSALVNTLMIEWANCQASYFSVTGGLMGLQVLGVSGCNLSHIEVNNNSRHGVSIAATLASGITSATITNLNTHDNGVQGIEISRS